MRPGSRQGANKTNRATIPEGMTNEKKLEAVGLVIQALRDTIKEAGQVPAGILYSGMEGTILLGAFERIVEALEERGDIRTEGNVIIWVAGD